MPKPSLFTPQDREIAETLVQIIYTNPFSDQRKQLNARFFQLAEETLATTHHAKGNTGDTEIGKVQSYSHVAKLILDSARANICKNPSYINGANYSTYEHLVYFHAFHCLVPSIETYIKKCLKVPSSNPKWAEFKELEDIYDFYFEINGQKLPTDYTIEEFASFCFQIRRAFFHTFHTLKGNSESMNRLRVRVWDSIFTHNMRRYLGTLYNRMSDIYTLICGPSGSGKEVVARCIGLSRYIPFERSQMAFERNFTESFHAINLSALSSTLIESELFGHRKGAFTGALQDKAGYFESSGSYGTVFLDEIGDTAPEIQVKLLRVLQTRQFQRLGDTQSLPFKGKVMAATNIDLPDAIRKGRFREDFYYRLCADQIETPSLASILQDNHSELQNLVSYICIQFAGEEEGPNLSNECFHWIHSNISKSYTWPGNFRELEQCIRNIMVQGEYHPHSTTKLSTDPLEVIQNGAFTVDELVAFYITQEHTKTPSYVDVASRLEIDPRTVKKYLKMSF